MVVPAIAADGAAVALGDTTLLAPTTFSVLPGQFWCVTGGNGSGKTTLLRAFLGSRTLTAGSCSVLGDPVDLAKPCAPPPRRVARRPGPVRPGHDAA
ncbi:ATP-binding cassette domain-containing protein [Streptomyces anulatus]|nr:ATP-binding cassette domain-containing protein [Streptomyces anulatus]WIY80992.1 ATP-binding cassette domain-containing protein [Streptomyces anulatus]